MWRAVTPQHGSLPLNDCFVTAGADGRVKLWQVYVGPEADAALATAAAMMNNSSSSSATFASGIRGQAQPSAAMQFYPPGGRGPSHSNIVVHLIELGSVPTDGIIATSAAACAWPVDTGLPAHSALQAIAATAPSRMTATRAPRRALLALGNAEGVLSLWELRAASSAASNGVILAPVDVHTRMIALLGARRVDPVADLALSPSYTAPEEPYKLVVAGVDGVLEVYAVHGSAGFDAMDYDEDSAGSSGAVTLTLQGRAGDALTSPSAYDIITNLGPEHRILQQLALTEGDDSVGPAPGSADARSLGSALTAAALQGLRNAFVGCAFNDHVREASHVSAAALVAVTGAGDVMLWPRATLPDDSATRIQVAHTAQSHGGDAAAATAAARRGSSASYSNVPTMPDDMDDIEPLRAARQSSSNTYMSEMDAATGPPEYLAGIARVMAADAAADDDPASAAGNLSRAYNGHASMSSDPNAAAGNVTIASVVTAGARGRADDDTQPLPSSSKHFPAPDDTAVVDTQQEDEEPQPRELRKLPLPLAAQHAIADTLSSRARRNSGSRSRSASRSRASKSPLSSRLRGAAAAAVRSALQTSTAARDASLDTIPSHVMHVPVVDKLHDVSAAMTDVPPCGRTRVDPAYRNPARVAAHLITEARLDARASEVAASRMESGSAVDAHEDAGPHTYDRYGMLTPEVLTAPVLGSTANIAAEIARVEAQMFDARAGLAAILRERRVTDTVLIADLRRRVHDLYGTPSAEVHAYEPPAAAHAAVRSEAEDRLAAAARARLLRPQRAGHATEGAVADTVSSRDIVFWQFGLRGKEAPAASNARRRGAHDDARAAATPVIVLAARNVHAVGGSDALASQQQAAASASAVEAI